MRVPERSTNIRWSRRDNTCGSIVLSFRIGDRIVGLTRSEFEISGDCQPLLADVVKKATVSDMAFISVKADARPYATQASQKVCVEIAVTMSLGVGQWKFPLVPAGTVNTLSLRAVMRAATTVVRITGCFRHDRHAPRTVTASRIRGIPARKSVDFSISPIPRPGERNHEATTRARP